MGRLHGPLLIACLLLATACGGQGVVVSTREDPGPGSSVPSFPVTGEEALGAFDGLGRLASAWKAADCAEVDRLTIGAESLLGERTCPAAGKGRAAPGISGYSDPEFYLSGDWFVALAREPSPAYFVFVREDSTWRLAAGPVKLVREAPKPQDESVTGDALLRARLVPQQHLTYLSDPAGVNGVRFASGDPMRALLTTLGRSRQRVRPDRVSVDVRLAQDRSWALSLPDGGALVFHAITLVLTQKPGAGRKTLAHPLYGSADLRAFTGKSRPAELTGSEIVFLATKVSRSGQLTTIAEHRELADITTG